MSKNKSNKTTRERVELKTRQGGTTVIPAPSKQTKDNVKEAENEADKT